jgi:hypothetical protein
MIRAVIGNAIQSDMDYYGEIDKIDYIREYDVGVVVQSLGLEGSHHLTYSVIGDIQSHGVLLRHSSLNHI